MSPLKITTTRPAPLTRNISWYKSTCLSLVLICDVQYRKFMTDPSITDYDKARKLLIGNHQWYLPCFHKSMTNSLLTSIEKSKPWNKSYSHCNTFEDIYSDVESWLKCKYINQLTIYDVALRIAVILNNPALMPKDYVYVHAIPLQEYKKLVKRGFSFPKLSKEDKVPYSKMSPFFGGLNAREIEDLLCHMGKGLVGKTLTKPVSCP